MSRLLGAVAATRFGMGARAGEIAAAASDPRGWLKSQISAEAAMIAQDGLMSAKDVLDARRNAAARARIGPMRASDDGAIAQDARQAILEQIRRETHDGLAREIEARSRRAATTSRSFAERWARFWSNHFTVAARNAQLVGLVGPFEREAIRPNVFGSFRFLLRAAVLHPAMLIYLDAHRSIGPSTAAAARRSAGLNENLAREILELHTLGAGSGYSQEDIIEFAKALTGWTINGSGLSRMAASNERGRGHAGLRLADDVLRDASGESVFIERLHEPGARSLLGETYGGAPELQAGAILDDLARHPATARRLALKLATHFVADEPPASAVEKLATAYLKTDGDLQALAGAVIDLDEAWGEEPVKFKSPEELLISAARAAGQPASFGRDARTVYRSLAQQPFQAPSPAGWPDDSASWSGADAVKKRLEWANATAQRMSELASPTAFLDLALGPLASARTLQSVSRAESARQGFTLALMSPEFQRR